jgi:hypothetical protein
MTSRPTTLVESDQLAQATVSILQTEDLVPKGKRWPFSRVSKAHKDYEKAVQDVTARRRSARENAIEANFNQQRAEADSVFAQAKSSAQTEYNGKIADARKPYDEAETSARNERDAAIAAANLAYQQKVDVANRAYEQKAAVLDQKRDGLIGAAKNMQAEAYAAIEAKRKAELAQLAHDLRTIALEGPMRVVEDRHAWSVEDRKKALIGLVDMAGREDFDAEFAEICLRNVAGYVSQDRFLPADAQHHRIMDVSLLEALVELAQRTPDKRPIVVKYIHDIVAHNPGHSSPALIKSLSELYVIASSDTETVYAKDVAENERVFDSMREQIADALKLTPRRSQAPRAAGDNGAPRESTGSTANEAATAAAARPDTEITAEVDVRELQPLERGNALGASAEAVVQDPTPTTRPSAHKPPPMPTLRRGKREPVPEGNN